MIGFTNSLVMICPVVVLQQVQAIGPIIGNSDNEFSVPLSSDGSEPATHLGLHAWASDKYINLVKDLDPSEFEARYTLEDGTKLITAEQVNALRGVLIISVQQGGNGKEHFDSVIASNSLERIVPDFPGIL